ncbi:MAG: MerR family transcriptional regulator [Chitinophagaceae bacterium]
MAKELTQITFDFSGAESQEFLSGKPIEKPAVKKKSTRGRKSLKATDDELHHVQVPEDEELFKKQYYSMGEVSEMFGLNQSMIRHWAREFQFDLRTNKKGDRYFKPTDVKTLQLVYDLIRRRKMTIPGAKDFLKKNKQANEKYAMIQSLQRMRNFLMELKASL